MANPPDIVQRVTQHIQSFQRSKVQLGEPREVVMPAARVGDIINHTSFWAALAGAVVGACVTAGIFALASAAVAAVGITGGLAAPIAGAVLGGVATWAVSDGIEKVTSAVTEFVNEAIGGDPSGPIILGSPSVLVNNKPLALAQLPLSVGCTRHSPPPQIAQGSETVSANGKPVARKGDKTECSATIAEGSPNVFFGSGQGTYVDMKPEFTGFQRALLIGMEFIIPPTMLISKGIRKAFTQAGKSLATRGAHVGATIAGRAKHLYKKSIKRFKISGNTPPYSHIPDSKSVGAGKKFTKLQKEKIIQENMKKNNGVVKSDMSGKVLIKPNKSQKGVTPPDNEWQIDHIEPRSKGGSNSYSNAQVLSRKENRQKSDK